MKIQVITTQTINVPDGATHYSGELLDEPLWYKRTPDELSKIGGHYWSSWKRGGWYIDFWSDAPTDPEWAKPLNTTPTIIATGAE